MSDKFKPTVVADILLWDYTVFPSGHFDVVWASPPCTEYSRAKQLVSGTLWLLMRLSLRYWK